MSTENSPKKPEQPFHLNQPESLVEDNKSNIQENDPIQSTEHTDIAFKNIILKQEKVIRNYIPNDWYSNQEDLIRSWMK